MSPSPIIHEQFFQDYEADEIENQPTCRLKNFNLNLICHGPVTYSLTSLLLKNVQGDSVCKAVLQEKLKRAQFSEIVRSRQPSI